MRKSTVVKICIFAGTAIGGFICSIIDDKQKREDFDKYIKSLDKSDCSIDNTDDSVEK